MNSSDFVVEIEIAVRPGSVKAFAVIRIQLPGGFLVLHGFKVIESGGKAAFVGFPSKQGNTTGKFFPIVDAEGELRKLIAELVLAAYRKAKAA